MSDHTQHDEAAQLRLVNEELREQLAAANKELELRRKVMIDIPCRCGHCGCDWDYEGKEQVEAMNLRASIEAYDAMDEQEQG